MKARTIFASICTAFVLPGLLLAAPASASPVGDYAQANAGRVCATLDKFPSFDGVTGTMMAIIDETGFSIDATAKVVVLSVANVCPRHWGLLRAYAAEGAGRAV